MKKSTLHAKEQNEVIVRITAQYVEQVQTGHRPSLSDYLVRYPDYTDALVDFVAYYHAFEEHTVQKLDGREALSEISQLALERAWCYLAQSEYKHSRQLLTLLVKTDTLCFSFASLAQELDLSVDIVMQLEQRRIDPASIPLELSRRIAQVIQQPVYAIQAYLTGLPAKSSSTQLRVAEQQESYAPAREGFRQALLASELLSDRQREHWCKIIEHETHETIERESYG